MILTYELESHFFLTWKFTKTITWQDKRVMF